MRMEKLGRICLIVGCWPIVCCLGTLCAQVATRTPSETEFEARDLLSESILSGEHYRIESAVTLKNHHYEFVIVTRWGKLPARGLNMLHLRLHELDAIERALRERWAPKELEGAFRTLRKTPEGALMILADPIGTIFRTPKNLKRLAAPALNEQDRRAGIDVRRRLAAKLGCDPETSNPILKMLLDELTLREKAGNLAGKIGLSAVVPGLGLLSLNADMQNDIVNLLPSEINAKIDAELSQLGSPADVRKRFLESRAFTTTGRLVFMSQLRKMRQIPGAVSLVENASTAQDETQALGVLEENWMLLKLIEKHPKLEISFIGLPVATLEDESVSVLASVDYLSESQYFETLRETLRRRYPTQKIELQLAGRASESARRLLTESKISVSEGLRAPLTDRGKPERGTSPPRQE